jgi:hypothetical protein
MNLTDGAHEAGGDLTMPRIAEPVQAPAVVVDPAGRSYQMSVRWRFVA